MCLFVEGGLGPKRPVLQLGLGVGTAVTFLRYHKVPVDVVELNPAVVEVAASHFGYTPTGGPEGKTYVQDAHAFLLTRTPDAARSAGSSNAAVDANRRYAVVLHDVFVGYNPWPVEIPPLSNR